MTWAIEPFIIHDKDLMIRQITPEDFPDIAKAIDDPDGFFAKFWAVDSQLKIIEMLHKQLDAQKKGLCNPLVYLVNGEVAGISRLMNIDPLNRSLEIGGTWISTKWKRSFVNTRVKYNLLKHAFTELNAERVEFRVNSKNNTSQMAVLRIGATYEGKIRHRQIHPNGETTDGHIYGMIQPEWPQIEERLQLLIAQKKLPVTHLPFEMETERLKIKIYSLADASGFLDLVGRNRVDLIDSFPHCSKLQSTEETKAFFAEKAHLAYSGHSFFYGIWNKADDKQIGQLQIKNIDWKSRSADLGYFMDCAFRRKGLTVEILKRAIDELAARNFNRIYVRILEENIASKRLIEKLGFAFEGTQRASFLTGTGKLQDVTFFSKIGDVNLFESKNLTL